MNKESFEKFIENDRGCDENLLDAAVAEGIRRAKNEQVDSGKFFILAAAAVFTFTICFSLNLEPLSRAMDRYYENWHKTMPGTAERLDGYVKDITLTLDKILGGE